MPARQRWSNATSHSGAAWAALELLAGVCKAAEAKLLFLFLSLGIFYFFFFFFLIL